MTILRLISALYFTYTKNILLLDPPTNENSDVSFAPHETTKNATTFLTFTRNSHLKCEEILEGKEQLVQNTNFGLWEKTRAQLRKNVPQITNEHTCDYLRYLTLLICLRWSVVWFWGVIRKYIGKHLWQTLFLPATLL